MLSYLAARWRTLKSEEGQDLAEYALLIGLIAVALVFIIGSIAGGMANIFNTARASLENARSNPYIP